MKIHIASDHAGYEMKNFLKFSLMNIGYTVVDHGPIEYNPDDDYPDFIIPCAQALADEIYRNTGRQPEVIGVIVGGSGEGEQIAANKVEGIRAIEYYGKDLDIVRFGREHNNANVISLGQRFMTNDEALEAVKVFIDEPFSNEERHMHRIEKITKYDEQN